MKMPIIVVEEGGWLLFDVGESTMMALLERGEHIRVQRCAVARVVVVTAAYGGAEEGGERERMARTVVDSGGRKCWP
ncbi:hypothetical protein L2E82_25272 [Cichorium intybus]|uniref:Uncharacterized protein n=1 Tax=Cichorium intybus TaxID=13427 RepID=A0ACB9E368_CICIN|nr:hypothetical protein L2E82_25272 [Cichorium intybus]